MLYVSWATDLEICSPSFCEAKPLSPKGLYHFVCDSQPFAISRCGEVEVNVYFTPKAHCKCIMVTLVKAMYGQSIKDETGHFRVKLDFTTREHFSFQEGKRTLLSMTLIELEIYNQDDFVKTFLETEGHKMVGQLKVKRRSDMMNVRTVYIGRPQEILTSAYAKYRRYVWTSGPENSVGFSGIGLRSKEDLRDIQRIQKFHIASPRGDANGDDDAYVHDNDGFSNANQVLPIEFGEGEALSVQMFNLKFDPPKFIELQLRSAEFSGDKKSYEVVYDGSIQFEFQYHLYKKKVVITALKMRVKAYIATLNNLGDGKAAKTV
jgi:hypothetical protein